MTEQDTTATRVSTEAERWREQVRLSGRPELATVLDTLDNETLTRAYRTWWAEYTRGIQAAPSNRRGQGVSADDAGKAGRTADAAVLTECAPREGNSLAGHAANDAQCPDLTSSPRGSLRCVLLAGHESDPLSLHHVDPSRSPETHGAQS